MDNGQLFKKNVKGVQNAMFCTFIPASEQCSAIGATVTVGIFPLCYPSS